jgi:hypothetical protein
MCLTYCEILVVWVGNGSFIKMSLISDFKFIQFEI